jgi:SAM-dependent methyltransferase
MSERAGTRISAVNERCAVCGGSLGLLHGKVRDPHSGEYFAVVRCRVCGLARTAPVPADLGPYYPPSYYGNRHGITLRHCLRRRLGFVSSVLGDGAGRRLLDIGCGDGSFLAAARGADWHAEGTELNPEPARSQGFTVASSLEEVTPSPPFHCITMWHTLEHMPRIMPVLEQARRLLANDGRLIIAVPDIGSLPARIFGRHWLHLDVPRHLHHFDAVSLGHCLDAAGFATERRWYQEIEYDLMGWVQSLLTWLLPTPNLFFDLVTGKPTAAGPLQRGIALMLGTLLTPLLLSAQLLGTLCKGGGTLIVVVRPRPEASTPATGGKGSP